VISLVRGTGLACRSLLSSPHTQVPGPDAILGDRVSPGRLCPFCFQHGQYMAQVLLCFRRCENQKYHSAFVMRGRLVTEAFTEAFVRLQTGHGVQGQGELRRKLQQSLTRWNFGSLR
jgi:hypothetical protein